jgi:hypothetical protein
VLISRTNSLTQIRYAALILISGVSIFLLRAWRRSEWPFDTAKEEIAGN